MAYNQFKRYQEDIQKWLDFKGTAATEKDTESSVMTRKCMELPAIKQYWVARWVEAKIEIKKLKEEKDALVQQLNERFDAGKIGEVAMSKATKAKLLADFNNSPRIVAINERIDELEIIITYLDNVKYILKDVTMDLNNYAKLKALEEA